LVEAHERSVFQQALPGACLFSPWQRLPGYLPQENGSFSPLTRSSIFPPTLSCTFSGLFAEFSVSLPSFDGIHRGVTSLSVHGRWATGNPSITRELSPSQRRFFTNGRFFLRVRRSSPHVAPPASAHRGPVRFSFLQCFFTRSLTSGPSMHLDSLFYRGVVELRASSTKICSALFGSPNTSLTILVIVGQDFPFFLTAATPSLCSTECLFLAWNSAYFFLAFNTPMTRRADISVGSVTVARRLLPYVLGTFAPASFVPRASRPGVLLTRLYLVVLTRNFIFFFSWPPCSLGSHRRCPCAV